MCLRWGSGVSPYRSCIWRTLAPSSRARASHHRLASLGSGRRWLPAGRTSSTAGCPRGGWLGSCGTRRGSARWPVGVYCGRCCGCIGGTCLGWSWGRCGGRCCRAQPRPQMPGPLPGRVLPRAVDWTSMWSLRRLAASVGVLAPEALSALILRHSAQSSS